MSNARLTIIVTSVFLCFYSVAAMADEPADLFKKGSFYGDARYRYEFVDQNGPAPVVDDAKASTLHTRIGFKTGLYRDFQADLEGEFVGVMGADDYNDTVNGKTRFPVVADPPVELLNQFWLSWGGLPQTTAKAGRQIINLDNQRFIGSSGWRQNDQTFDAAVFENKSIANLSLMYAFIRTVNRVFGPENPQGSWSGHTHLARAAYAYAPWLNLIDYGYWENFNIAPASSNETYGLRLTGDAPLDNAWTFFYEAEGARQNDYGNNKTQYGEPYYLLAPGLKWKGFSLQGGYESLGGNGTSAFQTPLATLHAFNGWADKFLTIPANGLRDVYGKASYKLSAIGPWIDDTVVDAVYHDYNAEHTNDNYGTEWDLQISRTFKTEKTTYPFKEWSVSLKYADYKAQNLFTDTQKIWLTIGTKF